MPQLIVVPRSVTRFLFCVIVFLLLMHFVTQIGFYTLGTPMIHRFHILGLIKRFDLNGESNIPEWYSSVTLLFSSAILLAIALGEKTKGSRFARHWMGLCAIFLYLSMDEAAKIHESATSPIKTAFHTSGVFFFAWVIPGLAFVAIIGLLYARFLMALQPRYRNRFLLSAAIYIGGAVGFEMLGGINASLRHLQSLSQATLIGVEEGMEMGGICLFIYTLLSYATEHIGGLNIRFGAGHTAPEVPLLAEDNLARR